MARKLRIPNIRLSASEMTQLDADYSTGSDLTVLSNLGFAAEDIAVVGEIGDEQTEQKDVASVSGNTTVTLSAVLKFPHIKQTPIYRSAYNQVSIERSYQGGAFSVLTTIDLQWDKLETIYVDHDGADDYSYKYRFYNSVSTRYSAYSPTLGGGGFSAKQVGRMVLNVRTKVKDPNRERVTDERIIQLLGEGQNVISGIRDDWWFLKVDTYELYKRSLDTGIATVGAQSYYDLDNYTNFNYLYRIRYLYNVSSNNQLYDLTPKADEEFDRYEQDQGATDNNNVLYYKLAPPDSNSEVGYFVVWPVPADTTGLFFPIYYKNMNTLNTIDDSTNIPYPEVLEDYAAWRIHNDLGNKTKADEYKDLFFGTTTKGQRDTMVTGIALLNMNQQNKTIPSNKPRRLWRYAGRRANRNSYGTGIYNSDYIKEFIS